MPARFGTYFEIMSNETKVGYKTNNVLVGREAIFCFCLANGIEISNTDQITQYHIRPVEDMQAIAVLAPVTCVQ